MLAFFISNQVTKGLTLLKKLSNLLTNLLINFNFIKAKFLHNFFWHNLIMYIQQYLGQILVTLEKLLILHIL